MRERTNFKELAHTISEAGCLKSARQLSKLENQEKTDVATQLETEFLLCQGYLSLFLRPSTDWLRLTHIMESNLL